MTQSRLSDLVEKFCQEKGWTVYRLAKEAGVDRGNLVNGLSGKKPISEAMLAKLAPVLDVSPKSLASLLKLDQLGEDTEAVAFEALMTTNPKLAGLLQRVRELPESEQDEILSRIDELIAKRTQGE